MINYTLSKTVAADYTSFTALAAALTGAPPDDDVTVTCLDTAIYDEENVDFMDALVAGRKLTIIGKIHPNGSRTTIRNTTMTGTILTRQHCIFWMNGTIDISGLKFDNSMTYDYKDKVSTCLYIDAPTCPYSKIHKCVFLGSGHYYGSGTPNWYEFGTEAVHWAGSPPATEYKYFHDNHVDRMGLYGLQLIGKTECHIYNNTFTRNHMSIAWWSSATAGSKIWNNIFVEDPSYFTVDAPYVENIATIQTIQKAHLSAFGLVDYNVYHCFNRPTGAQKVYFFDRRDTKYETLAEIQAVYATVEVNGLEANPKLSNYPGYRLDLSSPAIDMASDDHSGIDIDNKTRPEESGDVGCFEYAGRKRGPLPMFFR